MLGCSVCNPLLRTPLSLIIDDSCPVINLAYYWMKQRLDWKAKHQPGVPPERWEGDPNRLETLPRTIPAEFARRWGEWCAAEGIRGKFSFIPYPAGAGRIDQGMPGFPRDEFDAWLDVAGDVLAPNFDLTPEMLTHTHVVDLDTWELIDEWEQVEWVDPPVEPLTDYIAAAMRLLKDAGVPCDGVTSPGAFGKRKEDAYAKATLEAARSVLGNSRPFYFLWVKTDEIPEVRIWYPDKGKGIAIASVPGCTGDWFGGWTGFDAGDADRFITEDLAGGRLPEVLAHESPCVLVGHWPGFYFGGEEVGFRILKEVKRRLDAYDPDHSRTIWMKTSEIGRYWMARQLSDITLSGDGAVVNTRFPAARFTLEFKGCRADAVQVDEAELVRVRDRRSFRSGAFLVEGDATFVAFDLPEGETRLHLVRQ